MERQKIRNHPSVVIEGVAQVFAIMLLMLLTTAPFWAVEVYLGIGALLGAATLLLLLRWRRTTFQLNDCEMVVERNTVFKMKKSIPYSKIASINVDRSLMNRVFGTTKVKVNVNTSKNATIPEATMVLKKDLADRIGEDLSRHIRRREQVVEEKAVSVIKIEPWDVLIHGFFSQPTLQTISGLFFLAYSIWEQFMSANDITSGQGFVSLLMFFLVTVFPTVSSMVHYANFKVYRIDDTIYLQHGLVSTYNTSFEVARINAVKVRSTLVSRMLGRSYIEAEVIGLGIGKDTKRPLLCLLKKDAVIDAALRELVPEFIYEREVMRQPKAAKKVIAIKAAIYSSVTVLCSVYLNHVIHVMTEGKGLDGFGSMLADFLFIIVGTMILVGIALWAVKTYRIKELTVGDDFFTFVNGVMDRTVITISYDKVQIVNISKGPLARRFGLAVGSVSLLASVGGSTVFSGYFPEKHLNRIYELVMERLSDGKYDYRASRV